MKRDLERLKSEPFDLLVVGGGIHGLFAAWDASSRGLSVALIDKGDFGGATSANSLKLIHGGLRYLQHGDIKRIRQSMRERTAFMGMAPHLVHPFPSLVPAYGHLMKGREVMTLAFMVYNLLSRDRNSLEDPQKHIPKARVISAAETLGLFPGLPGKGLTGGAVFYDAQVYSTERLSISVAMAAAGAGACLANYCEAVDFLKGEKGLAGVTARDVLGGDEFEVRAGVVLNTAGPWTDALLSKLTGRGLGSTFPLARAVNIITRRFTHRDYALGVESREEVSDALVSRGGRLYFIAPWREHALVGTTYTPYSGHPDDMRVTGEDIDELVEGVNGAYPGAGLVGEDVTFFHSGLVPIKKEIAPGQVELAKHRLLTDHRKTDGVEGLITLFGVKYTTAREVAREAVDMVFRKLGSKAPPSVTAESLLPGGDIGRFQEFLEKAGSSEPLGLGPAIMRHLAFSYGSGYRQVTSLVDRDQSLGAPVPGSKEVIRAEVLHAVREEMACRLADVVLRRTDLGAAARPGEEALAACAAIMAGELGWDEERAAAEIQAAGAVYDIPPPG